MWLWMVALAAEPACESPTITNVGSAFYTAHVLHGDQLVLVDTMGKGHARRLLRGIEAVGGDLGLIVLTHGHGDHVGSAADLAARTGAGVVIGAGDAAQVTTGLNPEIHPTGPAGRAFKPFAGHRFPAVQPTLTVADTLDLRPWGVQAELRVVGGHTPGSLVVVTADGHALVGDLVRSRLPGPLDEPALHFFHEDLVGAHDALRSLVAEGISCFHLGHGGPVTRERLAAWLAEDAAERAAP